MSIAPRRSFSPVGGAAGYKTRGESEGFKMEEK